MSQIYRLLEVPTALTLQDECISETSLNFCPDTRPYIPEDSLITPFPFYTKPDYTSISPLVLQNSQIRL